MELETSQFILFEKSRKSNTVELKWLSVSLALAWLLNALLCLRLQWRAVQKLQSAPSITSLMVAWTYKIARWHPPKSEPFRSKLVWWQPIDLSTCLWNSSKHVHLVYSFKVYLTKQKTRVKWGITVIVIGAFYLTFHVPVLIFKWD